MTTELIARGMLTEAVAALAALKLTTTHPAEHPLEVECRRAVVDAARIKEGKKLGAGKADVAARDRALKKLTKDEIDAVMAPFRHRADEVMCVYTTEKGRLEAIIKEYSAKVDPRAGKDDVVVEWFYGSAYRSSGPQYTRVQAEMRRDELAAAFPSITFNLVSDGGAGFNLVAKVEDVVDAEILKRRSTWSEKEWVRQCWARGANPRVYNPFLKHGFEEENGLDYFGGPKP